MQETSVYDLTVTTIDQKKLKLETYAGRVLLIVNTASLCGFTPQYEGLQKIYEEFKDQGFAILAFPCDQFGNQEPGASQEIKDFCGLNYSITFPLFEKVEVNGPNAHPLFQFLKQNQPGFLGTEAIKWNFTKFLVDRKGQVVNRFGPTTKPEQIRPEIQSLL